MSSSVQTVLITEVLKDYIITEEGKSVTLECKLNIELGESGISGRWYKDSHVIISSNKTKISSCGRWQTLELKFVTKKDEGIYCFIVNTPIVDLFTNCIIYIKPHCYDNVTRIAPIQFEKGAGVLTKLRDCNIKEGGSFILIAEFSANIHTCKWYRYNHLMHARYPKFLMQENDTTITKLYFDKAVKTDSGIYTAVAKTNTDKYLCSIANVLVSDNYMNSLYNNVTIPHIWQNENELYEVYDKDDVNLLFKVTYDINTVIEWTKDGEQVKLSDRIVSETYGSKYISLNLNDVKCSDSGKYLLSVRHLITSVTQVCSALLIVREFTLTRPVLCVVSNGLQSIVASIGNGVTFQCSFDIPYGHFIYVVWIVGKNKIEKSNETFKVMCNDNDYILHIPVVTPEMAGEVTCQLRQVVPPRQSILICKTKSFLTIVPSPVLATIESSFIKENNIHHNSNLRMPISNLEDDRPYYHCSINTIIMYLKFCRSSGDNYFFEVSNAKENAEIEDVNVSKNPIQDPNALYPTPNDWTISWTRPHSKEWYAVDICKAQGRYSEIGICNNSKFCIKSPPEDKLFKFRIRNIKPTKKRNVPILMYVPDEVLIKEPPEQKKVTLYVDFKKSYFNVRTIESGAFGQLNLMRRVNDELLIAKFTNLLKQNKRKNANREFKIMRNLSHPNIVSLIEGVFKKNNTGMIFTMEYLWGGEFKEMAFDKGPLDEVDVIVYVRQILLALEYLHAKGIAHLDLKPRNIMFANRNSRWIKLIDFGMSRFIDSTNNFPTVYEDCDFVAPEMIHNEQIGTFCDMWSLGVITYWLLTGKYAFMGSTSEEKINNISLVSYTYDETQFRVISDRAKTFVSLLLRRQPNDRMTAIMALNDDWITDGPNEGRPKKIQVPIEGGFEMVEIRNHAETQWRHVCLVIQAVMKFRAKLHSLQSLGLRYTTRRYSTRQLARSNRKRAKTTLN